MLLPPLLPVLVLEICVQFLTLTPSRSVLLQNPIPQSNASQIPTLWLAASSSPSPKNLKRASPN